MDIWFWQLILAIGCVAWSAIWLVRRLYCFVSRATMTCGAAACGQCAAGKQAELIQIEKIADRPSV